MGSCKNRPAPFPGRMSYKVTKSGLVLFCILACLNVSLHIRAFVGISLVVLVKLSLLAK